MKILLFIHKLKFIPSSNQWRGWSYPSKLGVIAAYLTIVSFALYLISSMFNHTATKEDIRPLASQKRVDSLFASHEHKDSLFYDKFNDLLEKMEYEDIDKYPKMDGFSAHMLINIRSIFEERRKFIFDIGRSEEKNRISLYSDINNNLCFRFIDDAMEVNTIKALKSSETFNLNEAIYLICEIGCSDKLSFMRILVNGKEVIEKEMGYKLILPDDDDLKNFFLGGDINGKNNGGFDVSEIVLYSKTLNKDELMELLNYFKNKYSLLWKS